MRCRFCDHEEDDHFYTGLGNLEECLKDNCNCIQFEYEEEDANNHTR